MFDKCDYSRLRTNFDLLCGRNPQKGINRALMDTNDEKKQTALFANEHYRNGGGRNGAISGSIGARDEIGTRKQ
jgi:hypothetical protein